MHEEFLRPVDVESVTGHDRAHFFAVSVNMKRCLLLDRAHARGASKRGDGDVHVTLDGVLEIASASADRDIAAIDGALKALAKIDRRKEQVVELPEATHPDQRPVAVKSRTRT